MHAKKEYKAKKKINNSNIPERERLRLTMSQKGHSLRFGMVVIITTKSKNPTKIL